MLVVFPPIFVADTKIRYDHNFVASLNFFNDITAKIVYRVTMTDFS